MTESSLFTCRSASYCTRMGKDYVFQFWQFKNNRESRPCHTRGLHGLKTEARTRPIPEIVWPDPTRAAQLNLEPEPDPKSPPHPTTNNKKKKEKGCISRLHAKKRINQGSAISQTFTSYEKFVNIRCSGRIHSAEFMNFVWTRRWWPCKLWSFFVS